MAKPDLSNREIQEMGRNEPGSAARYLEERREEIAAEKAAERERDDLRRFTETFAAAGGNRADALAERKKLLNERAADAARRADEDASEYVRRHVSQSL